MSLDDSLLLLLTDFTQEKSLECCFSCRSNHHEREERRSAGQQQPRERQVASSLLLPLLMMFQGTRVVFSLSGMEEEGEKRFLHESFQRGEEEEEEETSMIRLGAKAMLTDESEVNDRN